MILIRSSSPCAFVGLLLLTGGLAFATASEPTSSAATPGGVRFAVLERKSGLFAKFSSIASIAKANGVQIVWDTSSKTVVDTPNIVYANSALTLPSNRDAKQSLPAIRPIVVNLMQIYLADPRTIEQGRKLTADSRAAQSEVEKQTTEMNALIAEADRRSAAGDKKAATQRRREADDKQDKIRTFQQNVKVALAVRVQTFRSLMLAEITPRVVADVQRTGANLVIDVSGTRDVDVSSILFAAAPYDGTKKLPATVPPLSKVLTVDMDQLATRAAAVSSGPPDRQHLVDAAIALAVAREADLLIDVSVKPTKGESPVLFSDPDIDITADVKL